ncbi:MAG TPA: hypothetical protein VKQ71_06590 [Acidimicrobiales bacterium]|nr:hypothetical protein [Acidimicrobiales bacterium]
MSGLGPRSRHGRQETIVVDGCGEKIVIKIEIGCEKTPAGQCGPENQGPVVPIPTPFLVIPWTPADQGARPIPVDLAVTNQSVQANVANAATATGWKDFEIQLSCTVANLGAVASPAAVAEFYVGADISIWNSAHEQLTPSQVKAATQLVGRASFSVSAGTTTTVSCPVFWKPGKSDVAQKGVLVQVFDLFSDPWTAPFDAVNDRHVARNDEVMDPIIF